SVGNPGLFEDGFRQPDALRVADFYDASEHWDLSRDAFLTIRQIVPRSKHLSRDRPLRISLRLLAQSVAIHLTSRTRPLRRTRYAYSRHDSRDSLLTKMRVTPRA